MTKRKGIRQLLIEQGCADALARLERVRKMRSGPFNIALHHLWIAVGNADAEAAVMMVAAKVCPNVFELPDIPDEKIWFNVNWFEDWISENHDDNRDYIYLLNRLEGTVAVSDLLAEVLRLAGWRFVERL